MDIIRELTDDERKAFSHLLGVVRSKDKRNRLKRSYADSKKRLDKIGFSIPQSLKDLEAPIGWAHKAIKVPARRIRPDGFSMRAKSDLLVELLSILEDNYFQLVEKMAIESSLQQGVSFVFTSVGDTSLNEPPIIMTARTALEASAEVNPRTNQVSQALEIVSRSMCLLYLPGLTVRIERDKARWVVTGEYQGIPGRVLCTPYVWGRTLDRPFGASRVTRPLMGLTDMGVRTMMRQETHAEFFASPQRALLGAEEEHFTDSNGNRISPLDALMGGLWALPDVRDEETGDLKRPDLKQLPSSSMQPHADMLRSIGMMVSSETSIPVGYLGISHDNPTSAEAMAASESDMTEMVGDELVSYKISREMLARNVLAAAHGEWTAEMERDLRGLQAHFKSPKSIPDSVTADALSKQVLVVPEIAGSEYAMRKMGIDQEDITRLMADRDRAAAAARTQALVDQFGGPVAQSESGGGESLMDQELKEAQILKTRLDAVGVARRAGVNADAAAELVGLAGLKFDPGVPITLKQADD